MKSQHFGTTHETSDENFEHFELIRGIVKNIGVLIGDDTHQLQLQIYIDGIPLYRSSKI